MRFLFTLYIFLLPFFSSPYLSKVFGSWSINYSLFPLVALGGMYFCRVWCTRQLPLPVQEIRRTMTVFATLQSYSVLVTFIASFFLLLSDLQYHDAYRGPEWNCVKEIVRAVLTFSSYYLILIQVRTEEDVWRVIRVIHLSLMVLIIYGYSQVISMVLPTSGLHSLLESVTPLIDQGWQGEGRLALYTNYFMRINLLTPESSTAAQILEVYFLPLLLASILSGLSVWDKRVFGFTIEMLLTFLTLPLIVAIFSSVGFFAAIIMLAVSTLFSLGNKKAFFILSGSVVVSIGGAVLILIYLDLLDWAVFFLGKVFDSSNTSTNTRSALLNASFKLFLNCPWGVGTNNNNLLMIKFVPHWAQSNMEVLEAIAKENLPTLNLWTEILSSIGLVGLLLLIVFFVMIGLKNIKFGCSRINTFASYAFILFALAVFMHGFHTSATTFLWLWSICGFYTTMGGLVSRRKVQ